jgi:hypothetical protein
MPIPAAIVRLLTLQPDESDDKITIVTWAYKLYFCGVDVEEQGVVAISNETTQAELKDLVNATIVASAKELGHDLEVGRILTSSNICGI